MSTPAEDSGQNLSGRKVRSFTLPIKKLNRDVIISSEILYPELNRWRPKCRSECLSLPRPCPFVSCKYNLYLDISRAGSIKFNFPELEVWEMDESCVLDIADRNGETLESVGQAMNLTRERVRQIENKALGHLKSVNVRTKSYLVWLVENLGFTENIWETLVSEGVVDIGA